MAKEWYFYDTSGNRRRVKQPYFYDTNGNRRTIKAGYFYDTSGNRRQFFANAVPVSGANFTMSNVGGLYDQSEGSLYGFGYGQYGASNDNSTIVVPNPPNGVGGSIVRCLFTTNQNSGDVGLPQNQLIYEVQSPVANDDSVFQYLAIPTIGLFKRSAAVYTPSFGTTWTWTYNGPYLLQAGNYSAEFSNGKTATYAADLFAVTDGSITGYREELEGALTPGLFFYGGSCNRLYTSNSTSSLVLTMNGFTKDPGKAAFKTLNVSGPWSLSISTASATYSYSAGAGEATWGFSTTQKFANGATYTITLDP